MNAIARLPARLSATLPLDIVGTAGAQATASLLTAGVGYVFWWLAVRQFAPEAVGFAAAAISAMTLLGTLSVLGLGTLIIGELARRPAGGWHVVGLAMLTAAGPGLLFGLGFALASPLLVPDLSPLASPLPMAMFAAGVGLTSSSIVLDQALVGLLRGGLQVWRGALFGAARLVAVGVTAVVLPGANGLAICGIWIGATIVSLMPLAQLFAERPNAPEPRVQPGRSWRALGRQGWAALGHHMLNVGLQFPGLSLPIAVAALLSATHTAYFYAAWMLAGGVFLASSALGLALYSVAARQPHALTQQARFTLALGLAGGAFASLLVALSGDAALAALFGAEFPLHTGDAFRVLVAAALPLVVIDHYVALARIRGRPLMAARLAIPGGVVQLALAVVGARVGGLSGLSLGWVLGVYLQAACMLPLVLSVVTARSRKEVHA